MSLTPREKADNATTSLKNAAKRLFNLGFSKYYVRDMIEHAHQEYKQKEK